MHQQLAMEQPQPTAGPRPSACRACSCLRCVDTASPALPRLPRLPRVRVPPPRQVPLPVMTPVQNAICMAQPAEESKHVMEEPSEAKHTACLPCPRLFCLLSARASRAAPAPRPPTCFLPCSLNSLRPDASPAHGVSGRAVWGTHAMGAARHREEMRGCRPWPLHIPYTKFRSYTYLTHARVGLA